ncbi:CLUMA_CG006577, isoform A [Clunio marinus]|uniref:Large ribosomal subunit protein uL14m n=1 Tax=Clunio marinus TaxID=568069 RepID=A0A1J1HZK0_9DIPT|nr:CLUMA_CG006577, isoform A [Clunio marinus]
MLTSSIISNLRNISALSLNHVSQIKSFFHTTPICNELRLLSRMRVVDNSEIGKKAMLEGKPPKVIHVYNKRRVGLIGDRVLMAIKGQKKKGILVGLKQKQRIKVPKFDTNNVVLIDDNGTPLGTRIFVPIPTILRTIMKEKTHSKGADYTKILAIASKFIKEMFHLKPILVDQKIDFPTCMYHLKPINTNLNESMDNSINKSDKSEVEMLEEKQNRILKKLDELKQTLMSMRGDMKGNNKSNHPAQERKITSSSVIKGKAIDINNLTDIVINVHPSNVPFSILALENQWRGRLNIEVMIFTHSTIQESDFTKAAKEFGAKVSSSIPQSNLATLKIIIIWKNVETTQMLTSPTSIPVYGEMNIIRYLNRIGPNEFSYEVDNQFANVFDNILDICDQILKQPSSKDRQSYIQQLSQYLGKNQFFINSPSIGIADIAASTTLKKLSVNSPKELPANFSSWLQKINSIVGY